MSEPRGNGLAAARSAYLRSARHQPVNWQEWGPDAFLTAEQQDKPILLDIGAVWCHWCHVMDRESYEDPETARLINEHFIAIKVDRDERPDVDTRYQAAVAAISGQGGWPLTAFLTPDGRPFFGGTYFPPTDQHGRPGLRRVLMTMAESWQIRRDEVLESAGSVMAAIEHNEAFDASAQNPGEALVQKLIESTLQQFDQRYGGFGSQPKFPNSSAIDLLLDEASRGDSATAQAARLAAVVTLEKMSKGGIYDHLAGGFHRYSVDERWVVPHFEKMLYDNSELLKNYVHAYQSSGETECARIAHEIIGWIDTWLSDRENGGFYASQDADLSPDDDGDYFTWTREEARALLSKEEFAIAPAFFDIGELGDMHHNPAKNTLHIDLPLATVAQKAGFKLDVAAELIAAAKAKLYAARGLRPTPFIDQTVYTGWNAMMISAYLEAGRVLRESRATSFALKTLDRILGQLEAAGRAGLKHVIEYGGGSGTGEPIPGTLDDYVFTGQAALDAWEVTGEFRYFKASLALAETTVASFYDHDKGGFFDTPPASGDKTGALSTRRKPLQDSPTPAGNAVAANLLLRLAALTGRKDLRQRAEATLDCFAGVVEHLGLYAASYGLALRRMVLPPVQVMILGEDTMADNLERTALATFAVNKSVIRLRVLHQKTELPPSFAEIIPNLPGQPGSFAVVCSGFACRPPVANVHELRALLVEQMQPETIVHN